MLGPGIESSVPTSKRVTNVSVGLVSKSVTGEKGRKRGERKEEGGRGREQE